MPSRDRYIIPELRDAWPATARLAAGEAPRVTSILALLAKEALGPWAAKLERAHMLDAMRRVLSAPTDGLARVGVGALAELPPDKASAMLAWAETKLAQEQQEADAGVAALRGVVAAAGIAEQNMLKRMADKE